MAKPGGRDRRLKSIFRRIQGPRRKIRGLPTLFIVAISIEKRHLLQMLFLFLVNRFR